MHGDFFYPQHRYRGQPKPENIAFDAHLQKFSQRVNYLSALATNGKIPLEKVFQEIEGLWQQLGEVKESLGIQEE